jgi:hypothetical protein
MRTVSAVALGSGLTGIVHSTVSGRMPLKGAGASGGFHATIDVTDGAGQPVDTCTTGRVTYKAKLVTYHS